MARPAEWRARRGPAIVWLGAGLSLLARERTACGQALQAYRASRRLDAAARGLLERPVSMFSILRLRPARRLSIGSLEGEHVHHRFTTPSIRHKNRAGHEWIDEGVGSASWGAAAFPRQPVTPGSPGSSGGGGSGGDSLQRVRTSARSPVMLPIRQQRTAWRSVTKFCGGPGRAGLRRNDTTPSCSQLPAVIGRALLP